MGVRRYGISLRVFNLVFFNNFGERVLSIFSEKIMTTSFNFNGSGRLGRERNLNRAGKRQ